MVVLILIDAFRWDYPDRTDFIKSLALQGVRGNFIEPFGFVPRDAYFGGLTPEESGYTHMFHEDPEGSPFTLGHGLSRLPREVIFGKDSTLRTAVRNGARRYVPPFGKHYLSSLDIPLTIVDQFNISERYAPWEKGKNYTSIFDLVEQSGKKWFQCSWPYTDAIHPNDDKGLTRHCISEIKAEHEFVYIHLMELDSRGHQFGAESREVHETIQNTDHCIQALHKHCLKVSGGNLSFILFGDHGMVNITRQIDVWAQLQKTGLKLKHDYNCFLDSTMARFWFRHAEARRRITATLEAMPSGYVLKEPDLAKFRIAKCKLANAELIFMAHPGAVIQPNFFDFSPRCSIQGMHGYDPAGLDNRGAIIYHRSNGSVQGRFDEEFQSWNLFPLLLENLGIQHPTTLKIPSITACPMDVGQQLTLTPEAEPFVRAQISTAVDEIRAAIPDAKSIYLTGGFGRGEGTVRKSPEGFQAINDYDIGVIVKQPPDVNVKELGQKLADQFKMDYVDIGVTGLFDGHWSISQLNFDLRHGSRVLWGDKTIFDRLPFYHGNEIPVYDACQLIYNRMAGFLTTELGHRDNRLFVKDERRTYFAYQFVKASIALGDALLIAWGAYDVSYAKRAARLAELLKAYPELSEMDRDLILRGYRNKLEPFAVDFDAVMDEVERLPGLTLRVLQWVCAKLAPGVEVPTNLVTAFQIIESVYIERAGIAEENARIARELGVTENSEVRSYRQRLYQVIAALCFSMLAEAEAKEKYWKMLATLTSPFEVSLLPGFDWDQALGLQGRLMKTWERTCH